MGAALQETRCIFIGVSMTDANLMRWLGLHSMEFLRDRRSFYDYTGRDVADDRALAAMSRHYWICTDADDPPAADRVAPGAARRRHGAGGLVG